MPSLDRLAELIERVVALLDEVTLAPEPAPFPKTPATATAPVPEGWVAFVHSPGGYTLAARKGAPPACGATLELEEGAFRVLRLGPSPLPGDRRRCAFLEREEPPAGARTFDR